MPSGLRGAELHSRTGSGDLFPGRVGMDSIALVEEASICVAIHEVRRAFLGLPLNNCGQFAPCGRRTVKSLSGFGARRLKRYVSESKAAQ